MRLSQTGRMRQAPSARWMRFSARQSISSTLCAFDWRARSGMITIRDALANGEGILDVRALGLIPVAHLRASPAITRGELMRYLAEIALAPDVILCNPHLTWRSDGPGRVIVAAGVDDARAEVTFSLNEEGRIATASAEDRPRGSNPSELTPTPWRGRFSDYREHHGYWLPFAADVSWIVDGASFIYWDGRLETWQRHAVL